MTDKKYIYPGAPLTRRETQVLYGVADGLSNKLISTRLRVSAYAIKWHVANCMIKLRAPNRAAAAVNFVLSDTAAAYRDGRRAKALRVAA